MNVFSFLETTAENSITFAGFISLFLVLARRDESLASEIAVLIRFILLGTITSLFLAALPVIVVGLGMNGDPLWRMASGLGLAVGVGMGFFVVSQRLGLKDREVTVYVRIAWVLATIGGLTHAANISGWPLSPNGSMYLAAIWLTLAISAVNLVDLVFRFALNEPAA